jgi:tRNA A37 threonylcarbamoyladenosine synthetase subunit TsaC/SUA5/YrdC
MNLQESEILELKTSFSEEVIISLAAFAKLCEIKNISQRNTVTQHCDKKNSITEYHRVLHSVTPRPNTVKLCDKKNKYHRVSQSTTQRNTVKKNL